MPYVDKSNLVVHKKRFAIVPAEIMENPFMSFKAKSMIVYILGKPQGWVLRISAIMKHCKESKATIYSAIKELREFGYLELETIRNKNGKIESYTYHICDGIEKSDKDTFDLNVSEEEFEEIISEEEDYYLEEIKNQDLENQDPKNPDLEKPDLEKPDLEFTEVANNIEYNNNIINNNKKEKEEEKRERAEAFPESDSEEELMNEKMEFEEGVYLTINEFEKLEKLYGEDGVLDVIERYSLYKKTKNKSYSDDFLTLYRWFEKDEGEKRKLFESKNGN